jgi:hypothetical protein
LKKPFAALIITQSGSGILIPAKESALSDGLSFRAGSYRAWRANTFGLQGLPGCNGFLYATENAKSLFDAACHLC